MKEDFLTLFFKYLDFLRSNEELDITTSYDKYKIFIRDEKQKVHNFFESYLKLNTFRSFDIDNFLLLLEDIYTTNKVINRQIKENKNPYIADVDFLDNIIKSLGVPFTDILSTYVKPKFSQDIVNLYKIKGTPEAIKRSMAYFFLTPVEVFEVWLEENSKLYNKYETDLYFNAKPRRINYLKYTNFDVTIRQRYEYVVDNDSHWYYKKDEIYDINKSDKQNGLKLPSLTPYIKIVSAPDFTKLKIQYSQLVRNAHYEYIYFLENNNLDKYRLLYHEDTGKFISILEIILLLNYLYNVRFKREFIDSKELNYLFSNITAEFDEENYSDLDKLTRRYEYDELKKKYDLFNSIPVLKDETSTQHGFVKDLKISSDKIVINKEYRKRLLINNYTKDISTFNSFMNNIENYAYDIFGNTIVISGGVTDNNITDDVCFMNYEELNNISKPFKLPLKLKNHLGLFMDNKYIVLGGETSSGYNTKVYSYDLEYESWYNIESVSYSFNVIDCLKISNSYALVLDEFNNYKIFSVEDYSFTDINLSQYNLTGKNIKDWDYNDYYVVILFLHDKKLIKINTFTLETEIVDLNTDIINNINQRSKVFIDSENEIGILTESKYFRYTQDLQWVGYNFNVDKELYKDQKKLKVQNNKYLFLNGFDYTDNKVFDEVMYIEFEIEDVPLSSYDANLSLLSFDDIFKDKQKTIRVYTYEDYFNYSNRRAAKENYIKSLELFTQKGDSYLFKDPYFDDIENLNNADVIDINEDDFLIDEVEQLKQLLLQIDPNYEDYIESSLVALDIEFNRRFFNLTNLLDIYIKLFFLEDGYFTQYYLLYDKNVEKIIDKYKPIITRYSGLTTVLNIRSKPDDSFFNDEYIGYVLKQYLKEFYQLYDYGHISSMKQYIDDIPYIPERTRSYDTTRLWRNEFHDLQLKEVNEYILTQDFFGDNIDPKTRLEMILTYVTEDDYNVNEDFYFITYLNTTERFYFNYSFENSRPIYDNVIINREFDHDDVNIADYLNIEVVEY